MCDLYFMFIRRQQTLQLHQQTYTLSRMPYVLMQILSTDVKVSILQDNQINIMNTQDAATSKHRGTRSVVDKRQLTWKGVLPPPATRAPFTDTK